MASEKSSEVVNFPPAYFVNERTAAPPQSSSKKSKALFGYAVGVTTALLVVLVMGGVYYYRSIDILQESIKKFQITDNSGKTPVSQDVEIDMANNYAVFYLTGDNITPGTFAILDYTKSMTGLYDPKSRRCYLNGGLPSDVYDVNTLNNLLEKNVTQTEQSVQTFRYKLGNSYPVSDKSILPAPLKRACNSLPVYWMEPAQSSPHGLTKRGHSVTVGINLLIFSFEYTYSWD